MIIIINLKRLQTWNPQKTMKFEVRKQMPPSPPCSTPAFLHNTRYMGVCKIYFPLPASQHAPFKPRSFRWGEAWHEVHHLYLYSQAGQLSKYPGDDNLHALVHPE